MATIAQLNVQIGVAIANLQKGLRQAERELRTSGQRMARAGAEISTSLSIPLAILGGSAIKAAGDFESLRLAMRSTFQNAGRSIQEADAEVENLRKSALAPGLDFEQAVKASIRLQSVGFSAEQSRKTIEELANAIASTGGTAENLSSVTVQFSQMISKGKVLAGDLRIVQENLPIISDLMLKAFGTANSEKIQELGITGKEFVEKITAQMQGLNRVQGGISNAIVNAGSAIKVFLSGIGEEINRVFKIGEKSDAFAASLQSLGDAFRGLSDGTKKFVVELGLAIVVLGPALKIFGAMKTLGAQAVSALGDITKALGFVAGKALQAAKAFQALSLAQKATVVGLAIAAVTALYFAYEDYANSLADAEAAQQAVNDVQRDATASTEVERAKINNLVAVLNDNTESLEHKRNALNALKNISPSYFGDLDLEKGKVEGLTVAVDAYVRSLERSAIVKQATDEIAKLSTQLKNIEESGAPTLLQQTGNAVKTLGATLLGGTLAVGLADKAFGNLNESTRIFNQLDVQSATKAKIEALRGLVKENIDLTESENAATASTKKHTTATGELTKSGKVLKDVIQDISKAVETAKLLGEPEDIAKLEAVKKGIERLIDAGFKPASAEVQNLKKQLDELTQKPKDVVIDIIPPKGLPTTISPSQPQETAPPAAPISEVVPELTEAQKEFEKYAQKIAYAKSIQEQLNEKTFDFASGLTDVISKLIEQGNVMGSVFVSMGDAISKAAADGETSFAALGKAAAGAAAKIIRAYIQQGVAAAVAKALQGVPFPFNLAAAAAAGGIAAALFTNLIGKIGIKGFASGTRDAPGGLAIVGERGPELVNIPRHSQVFNAGTTSTLLNSGQPTIVGGTIRFDGRDMYLMIERQNQLAQRSRGFGLR